MSYHRYLATSSKRDVPRASSSGDRIDRIPPLALGDAVALSPPGTRWPHSNLNLTILALRHAAMLPLFASRLDVRLAVIVTRRDLPPASFYLRLTISHQRRSASGHVTISFLQASLDENRLRARRLFCRQPHRTRYASGLFVTSAGGLTSHDPSQSSFIFGHVTISPGILVRYDPPPASSLPAASQP